jgi:hypothetical protein
MHVRAREVTEHDALQSVNTSTVGVEPTGVLARPQPVSGFISTDVFHWTNAQETCRHPHCSIVDDIPLPSLCHGSITTCGAIFAARNDFIAGFKATPLSQRDSSLHTA